MVRSKKYPVKEIFKEAGSREINLLKSQKTLNMIQKAPFQRIAYGMSSTTRYYQ